jgi:hypothetical protein
MKVAHKLLNSVNLVIDKEDGNEPITYKLILDLNAVVRLEEKSGVDITNPENWKKISFSLLTLMIWAALDTHHPDVDIREVRSWFQMGSPELQELFYMLVGVKKDVPGENQPAAPSQ